MKVSHLERARRYVAKCMPAVSGQGGHDDTFHVACVLVNGFALNEADALTLLLEFNRRCLPPWTEAELIHKIKSAAHSAHRLPLGHLLGTLEKTGGKVAAKPLPAPPPKPTFQKTVLARIANKVADIKDVIGFLAERSPVQVNGQDSASVLRHLYLCGSGEKILIFTDMRSQGQFLWEADRSDLIQQRHLPAGNDGVWFLPQPVSGGFFPNPRSDGNLSRRSEEAVTAFRYAVLESDEADANDWLTARKYMDITTCCRSSKPNWRPRIYSTTNPGGLGHTGQRGCGQHLGGRG